MEVLEDDHRGLAVGHLDEEVGHREPQLVAGAARFIARGKGLVRDESRQELARVGGERSLGRIERRGQRVKRPARLVERRALRDAEQRADHLGGEAERMAAAERLASRDDDPRRRSVRGDAREDFATEAALSDARRARNGDHDGCRIVDASLVGADDLRELDRAAEERRAAGALAALSFVGGADDRRTVAAHLEFETAARELRRRRVGEKLRRIGGVCEARRAVDDLAHGAGEIDLAATGGDADFASMIGEVPAELQCTRRFAAKRSSRADVRDDRILAERNRVGAATAQLLDDLRPSLPHSKPDDRREEARASHGHRVLRGGRASRQRQIARALVLEQLREPDRDGSVASMRPTRMSSAGGTSGTSSVSLGASVVTSRASVAMAVGPTCGGRPAMSSKRDAPSE